ncbi:hypothetical protein [Thermococcus peptonophilus]|uniref:Uncharacterized protein n=1 Tax=Thermococcus peptonophilus TaxID=53952 RepID=A0A142CUZ3_9EURY|nr:hypothetical protein [Thermococcus peptonophilus]AMQ18595.1 hypothetical protein A0127_05150 [Thermococcus peptonophilus]
MKELPKVPLDIKKIIAEEDPVRKAYFLGYFIAYYGHTDWVGIWRELRDSIFESAEESGVLREAIEAYRRGKKEGARDRELAIARGLYRPLPTGDIQHKVEEIQKISTLPLQTRVPKILKIRLTGEPKMLLRSEIIGQVRTLRLPRFLGRR